MASSPFQIVSVRNASDLEATKGLFRAYAASLDIDLAFQDFDAEMAAMPGKYAPPGGELLLARVADGMPVGCVGLRPLDTSGTCEMKRLYVAPQGRGLGIGRRLVERLLEAGARIGYREIKLDTLSSMIGARALYLGLGFEICEPYYLSPFADALFMRRRLKPAESES